MDPVRLRSRNGKAGMSIQPEDGPEGKADAKEFQEIVEALGEIDVFPEAPASSKPSPEDRGDPITADS